VCEKFAKKNPKGISPFSPALPDAIGLRWVANQNDINPERVESLRAKRRYNPVGVGNYFGRLTQGSRSAPTLG